MKINRIILENFKCFENEEFELSAPYTLIIGNNGKGKTAILDAIAVGISALLSGVSESGSSRSLKSECNFSPQRHREHKESINKCKNLPIANWFSYNLIIYNLNV